MRGTYRKFSHPTLPGLFSATSSPESAAGLTPSDSQAGQPVIQSGPEAAPANPSVLPGKDLELPTLDTSGRSSPNLSAPASLQQSLASRLRAKLAVNGSPEYSLTWKEWAISGQEPICALRASARPTSGRDCSGWPTPRTVTGGAESAERKQELGRTESGGGDLQAVLAGWTSPIASEARQGFQDRTRGMKGTQESLTTQAILHLPPPHLLHLRMGYAELAGLEGHTRNEHHGDQSRRDHAPAERPTPEAGSLGAWSNADVLWCRDGKARRVESGTFPLAHGIPGRVGLLRGYGNAIVPQVAQAFIEAFQSCHE